MPGSDHPSDEPSHGAENAYQKFHRQITPEPEEGFHELLETVAELEDCDVESLPPLYDRVDHLVEHLFEDPPSTKAQAEVQFTYYDYRITVDQLGKLSLRKQVETLREIRES